MVGFGVKFFRDGSKYIGEVSKKGVNGFGIFIKLGEYKYEGYWRNHLKHGKGTLY